VLDNGLKMKNSSSVLFVGPSGQDPKKLAKLVPMPQLGLSYLATIAKEAGFIVNVFNEGLLGRKVSAKELAGCDIICLSCMTSTIDRGREIAKEFKSINPKGRTIIGGIHASMAPYDVLSYFDQVIIGEAEGVIVDVLKGKLTDFIVYGSKVEDLDNLPIVDVEVVEGHKKVRVWPVMTSRGCPFNCIYCSSSKMFGNKYRAQSPERVIQELMQYRKGHILFFDDNFTASQQRTSELMDLMIENGFDRNWSCEVRTETTKNAQLISKMSEAGCQNIGIGFESINNNTLQKFHKFQTVDDIKRSIKVLHDNSIKVWGMFILGSDEDTKKSFKKTAEFCQSMEIDYAQFSILTPFPGTQLYNDMEEQKRIIHKNWRYYDALHTVFVPKNMTPEELQNGLFETFKRFYSIKNGFSDLFHGLRRFPLAMARTTHIENSMTSFYRMATKFAGKISLQKALLRSNTEYYNYLDSMKVSIN
jgi:anaerobic magnesium-protoporphyrin IX monomethyl ester cyclase